VGRTIARRGRTPILVWPWTKKCLSVIGAVTWDGRLFFHDQDKGMKNYDVARFLQQLLRKIPGKLLVIWDRGTIHKGPALRALYRAERGRIKTVRLPQYAPELNPEEGIWHLLKDVELKNVCCNSLRELRRALRLAQVRLRRKLKRILACFKHSGCLL
jgi:transposase